MKKQPPYTHSIHSRLQTVDLGNTVTDLFVPDEAAMKEAYQRAEIPFPYWSKLWPAAIALSKFLLDHPELIKAKKVVELGGGLGLPSLVAAPYAASVLCTDCAVDATVIARESGTQNGCTNFKTAVIDWNDLPEELTADVVLLSDVNYDPASFENLWRLVNQLLKKGVTVILSTPQRLVAKGFVESILPFCILQEERKVDETPVSLFVLHSDDGGQTKF